MITTADTTIRATLLFLLMIGFIFVIVDTVGDVVKDAPRYETRLTEIFSWIADKTGQENMSFKTLDENFKITEKIQGGLGTFAATVQGVLSEFLGLDNALFWALVIFVLNYIPIVGGLLAVLFPVLFAIVQFDSLGQVGLLALILFGAQTIIGNTIQPKMMGDSMNLSALVVILALSVWGALWGGVGAFLSAPLTVIIMIILAQFPTTRWIAVLLSADGNPDMDEDTDRVDGEDPEEPVPSL